MRRLLHPVVALATIPLAVCGPGAPASEASSGEAGGPLLPTQGVYGRSPAAAGGRPSVIMLTPEAGTGATEAGEGSVTIDQFGLTFSPIQIVTRPGVSIVFTNSEAAIAHNVRIRAVGDTVDVLDADANPGERLTVELPTPGGYDVLCDMHPGMTAFIFASPATHTALADTDGTFVLEDVPPGTYTLQLWTADDRVHEPRQIEVGTGHTGIDLGLPG